MPVKWCGWKCEKILLGGHGRAKSPPSNLRICPMNLWKKNYPLLQIRLNKNNYENGSYWWLFDIFVLNVERTVLKDYTESGVHIWTRYQVISKFSFFFNQNLQNHFSPWWKIFSDGIFLKVQLQSQENRLEAVRMP